MDLYPAMGSLPPRLGHSNSGYGRYAIDSRIAVLLDNGSQIELSFYSNAAAG